MHETPVGRIRLATSDDADRICEIYNHYVSETVITFETEPVGCDAMIERIARADPWYLIEDTQGVAGYAYSMAWRERAAYRASVETSIYLAKDRARRGIGRVLYTHLLDGLARRGVHTAVGCIALPNPESVALHEKLGFEAVGEFKEIGHKFDRWIDVGYWQKIL